MNACTVQRGIFSLRACGNAASEACSQCAQPICFEHCNYGREQILCPTCHAASPNADKEEVETDAEDWDSPGWSGRWSSDYRSSHAYVPIGAASASAAASSDGNFDAGFDKLDRNAFATRSDGAPDESDADVEAVTSNGFADS